MKLYSRVQVVKLSIIVFILAVFFTSMLFLACSKKSDSKTDNNISTAINDNENSFKTDLEENKTRLENILETNI